MQQPAIWRGWATEFGPQIAGLRAWITAQNPDEIWLCGAGTSAYIGDLIAAALGADPRRIRAIATTDLVACPHNYTRKGLRPLVISFGRSGNSAESLGTLDLLDQFLPDAPRLNITCNAKSALATRAAKHQKVITLPAATHDAGFAMTSSYSTMLLTALLLLDEGLTPAHQKPLRADIVKAIGREARFGNDCDLFAFSEATLGAAEGFHTVFGLILGTGIGGGFCIGQKLFQGANGTVGEVGHLPFPASLNMPLRLCGCGRTCGRTGCFEALGSAPGMVVLGLHLTGHSASPAEIAAEDGEVFKAWLALTAALIASLQCTLDPDCIVLGGGLSNIEGVAEKIRAAAQPVMLRGTSAPTILKAKFGDSSGTCGAA